MNKNFISVEQSKKLGEILPLESEDERIRRVFRGWIYTRPATFFDEIPKEKMLAWLEKQGEQKQEWSEEDENGLGDALWAIKQARTIAKDENDMGTLWYAERWLNTIKERVQSKQDEYKLTQRKDFISIPFGVLTVS